MFRTTLLAALLALPAGTQDLAVPAPPPSMPGGLRMPHGLWRAYELRDQPLAIVRERLGRLVPVDEERRALVLFSAPWYESAVSEVFVEDHGGIAETRWKNLLDAWVPLSRLPAVARALPSGHRLELAATAEPLDIVGGQGPCAMGTDAWRDGGADGAGLTVAVVDADFMGLTAAVNAGTAPSATQINLTANPFEDTVDDHGTACTEIVFDHAPAATYRLYKIESNADLGSVVDDCIDNGVDVISHSLGWAASGYDDGEGHACEAAQDAADAGILFVTSAGNYARNHWSGAFNDTDGDDWHNWAGTSDELNQVQVGAGSSITLSLVWDDSGADTDDYDLFLYDALGTTVLASSESFFEFYEQLTWTNNGGSTVTVAVAVQQDTGNGNIELFGQTQGDWEHFVTASSVAPPVNTIDPLVISVGAVHEQDYASPPGSTGIQMPYSSRGPTNGGKTVPTVAGPTEITTFVDPAFGGTSAATPNVAGALLCLWSDAPQYTPEAIRWLLVRQAQKFKDWGTAGNDMTYGGGGVALADFSANTIWLSPEYGNVSNDPSAPVASYSAAEALASPGRRVLVFPGVGLPIAPILFEESVLVESAAGASLVD